MRPFAAISGSGKRRALRDADSSLRCCARPPQARRPSDRVREPERAPRRSPWGWFPSSALVNIGGIEGTGAVPLVLGHGHLAAGPRVRGRDADGSLGRLNGVSAVQNGATGWSSVPGTVVRYSSSGTGPVAGTSTSTASLPRDDAARQARAGRDRIRRTRLAQSTNGFKGESSFYAPSSATCGCGESPAGATTPARSARRAPRARPHARPGPLRRGLEPPPTTTPVDWRRRDALGHPACTRPSCRQTTSRRSSTTTARASAAASRLSRRSTRHPRRARPVGRLHGRVGLADVVVELATAGPR